MTEHLQGGAEITANTRADTAVTAAVTPKSEGTRRVKIFTVHGTFANEADWDNWDPKAADDLKMPEGKARNFVNHLSDYLKRDGVTFDELDHTQYNWSGLNSHDERRTSAIGLKKLIEHELSHTQERTGQSTNDYYNGGVFIIGHSHGGTISRLAMNLWDKDSFYYRPEKRIDPATKAVVYDEFKADDHCQFCRQQRNGEVGPNTASRPDCVITLGSPFVTFEERKGGLLAAHIVVWSLRFLTLLPLLAYYLVMRFTGAMPGDSLFGAAGKALADPKAGLTWLQTPIVEVATVLIVPLALYWFLGRYTPSRIIVQVERRFGKGTVVNSVALVAKVISVAGLLALVAYYGAYLSYGRPGIAWWLELMNTPVVMGFMLWVLPLLLYWLVAISIPGRSLSGLGERVSALREKLPVKYDPREEKQAFYLNYQTPGDEPGLGLRLQGLITWIIQTLALAMACVLAAGIVLAIIAGLEALLLSSVLGGQGILGTIGLSPKIGDQQWRFISLMDVLTAAPRVIWNTLASIPGLTSLMGGPAELRLGGLANAPQAAEYMPVALFTAAGSLLFGLLPTILLALTVAFAVGVWLRNSMAGFGRENFAWTLANKIRVSKRAGPNSMLRTINISRDAWWNRDIAHCFYYKSDTITKDLAHFISHPDLLKADEPSYPTAAFAAAAARWLVVALFVSGIFAAAVPIAHKRAELAATAEPSVLTAEASVLTGERERGLMAGATFLECTLGCPVMVVVPAGQFMMGSTEDEGSASERPRHAVTIAKPFAVSKTEVLAVAHRACKLAKVCAENTGGNIRAGSPATELSWADANTYAQWLSKITGKTYRLLSEAEWEYAARAGSADAYSWGRDVGQRNANCKGCGGEWNEGKNKAPAGSFKANAFGLQDMHGNVWEWVADTAHADYQGAPGDGSAWIYGGSGTGGQRMIRGGDVTSGPAEIRSAHRTGIPADTKRNTIGFRVARAIEQ